MEIRYLGKARENVIKTKVGEEIPIINGSICLDELPPIPPHKNGRTYFRFTIKKMTVPDSLGNTHSIVFNDRRDKMDNPYIN